ncbi:MAG: methionine--tRNA ligase [Bacillota bacterium]
MENKKTFYITTPIYYPSDNLHIGHAYTTVAADTFSRFKRMTGHEVWFLTGTDEHGQKIERAAKSRGQSPKEFVDNIVAGIQKLWERLEIGNNDFIRTTEDRHKKVVSEIFEKLYRQGDIYKASYEGWYCTPCETFWAESRLEDGNCPDCGRSVELLQEESYFFRMSKYADRLLKHIEENPHFIQPVSRKNEMVSFIKSGLEDLCVSRTTFDWGIKVPFDPKHVVYVWVDALTNYISALGYNSENDELYKKFWPADIHLVGKDIVRFHTVIWPMILMAAELPLPRQVVGHGWLLLDSGKMSKSKGNVVDPHILIDKYGVDAVRYYLLREMGFGLDGLYSEDALINRINKELANDLGNLVSRTLGMADKYFKGEINAPGPAEGPDGELISLAGETPGAVEDMIEKRDLSGALAAIWRLVSRANKYVDETAPWVLVKSPEKKERLNTVLYNLTEAVRFITILTSPFMPLMAPKVWPMLGIAGRTDLQGWESLAWGKFPGGTVVKRGEALFPRIETEERKA